MKKKVWWESLLVVILFWYPLRHIYCGLDLWDTGYSCANFAYMGLEHMDSMWLFSTYLANAAGHLLTMLPGAGGLAGMNLYTGMFVSALAIAGYFFCTGKLGISRGITFVGELAALSLCWCPTVSLYNYLTYVFFLACVILLYIGLTEKRMWCLAAAGVCLGMNVLVRFSNLPEAAMIVAVWVYAFLAARKRQEGSGIALAVKYTLFCLGGYLAALAVGLGYLHIRYGLDAYVNGIMRLFAMTEDATDYKPTSMLTGLIAPYRENLYWAGRIFVIVLVGMAGFAAVKGILRLCGAKCPEDAGSRLVWRLAKAGACGLAVLMLAWLYYRGFCSLEFYAYGSILRPGILFLMLTMGIALIRIFHPESPLEERLISGMVLLVVLLTSLGSNNGVYPSLNNLFVAAPYTLWNCQRFLQYAKEWYFTWVGSFPAKAILTAFLAMFLFQTGVFGVEFVFAEATGARDITDVIENNEVLAGVKMSPERAEWMSGLSAYVNEQDLKGQEVILYGQIPALSYYLQMPSAFNPWSDLASYQYEVMERDMEELVEELAQGGRSCPVVLLERNTGLYLQGGIGAVLENGVGEKAAAKMDADRKLKLLGAYMDELNYELTYENAKFMLYQVR